MAVNTETLKDNPDFGKALAGAWYETMAIMTPTRPRARRRATRWPRRPAPICRLRSPARDDPDVLQGRRRRRVHRKPGTRRHDGLCRDFLFDHGLLGKGAPRADVVGIELAGQSRRHRQCEAALHRPYMAARRGRKTLMRDSPPVMTHATEVPLQPSDPEIRAMRLDHIDAPPPVRRGCSGAAAVRARADRLSDRLRRAARRQSDDKLLPRLRQLRRRHAAHGVRADKRTRRILLWNDTRRA